MRRWCIRGGRYYVACFDIHADEYSAGHGREGVSVARKLAALRIAHGGSAAQRLDRRTPTRPHKRQKPRQLFATAGVSAEKGDMILERTAKGQTGFAQLFYAPRLAAQSAYAAPTQSRYTCDGAVKWYLLLAQDSAKERPKRQICCSPSVQPNDPFSSVPNRSFSRCRSRVGLLSHLTFRWPRYSSCVSANVGQWRCWFYRQRMCL